MSSSRTAAGLQPNREDARVGTASVRRSRNVRESCAHVTKTFSKARLPHALLLAVSLGLLGAASPADKTKPGEPSDVTFDDIKFDIEKGARFKRSMLPKKIEKMNGSAVRIRGYILPSFQQEGIKQFVLVRDNMECCFGPGAALYDCIFVEMQPGETTAFTVRPVAVEGVFSVKPFLGPDGKHLAIYHLRGKSVK